MEQDAIALLNRYRLATIATLRADGWPHATMVSYANQGLHIYFIISQQSQKLANIARDDRVSIAIGRDTRDPWAIDGLSMSARARVLVRAPERDRAYQALLERHPEFAALPKLDPKTAAVIEARPELITILNYAKGFGHTDAVRVGAGGLVSMEPARVQDWGWGPSKP
jgi:general stress protein 26